jgi:hypothetical protein
MIMVQREFRIAREHRATFEQQSREGLWPAFLHFGAPMVAFGSWGFGGPSDPFVTHTVYEDFTHWQATRAGGAMYQDPAIRAEIEPYLAVYGNRNEMVESSEAQLFELFDGISRPQPFYRRAGQQVLDAPPTFGKGSVISERTLALTEGTREEFLRVSRDTVWPWLETQGGRGIAIGHNLMGASNEITTWFAFPSYAEWHRCTRPATAHAPQPVVDAYYARAGLVRHQRGRLLVIGTDFGTRV